MRPTGIPRLRQGERLLITDRESRGLRALADGFVCVVSIAVGVAFNALVMDVGTGGAAGSGATEGLGVLVTIALTLAPVFLFMVTRPLSHVLLTNQRVFVGTDPGDMDSAEFHQIAATRIWLATLFVKLADGKTLAIGNMRKLHAIAAVIRDRSPA